MQGRGTIEKIYIERAQNGGWLVECGDPSRAGVKGNLIACFTDHDDLIAGLDDLLRPAEPTPPEE